MKCLGNVKDIWYVQVEKSDIEEAIEYATISLSWTFDRLRYGAAQQKNMNKRLLNIMKGVLNQTLLERILTKKGYKCKKDWTNYRQSDIFDFDINGKVYDVKTGHVYSEYSKRVGRKPFSPALIIKYKDNKGPDWRTFFPISVTLSQITYKKHKDGYIFGIAETFKDINKIKPEEGDKGFWCSVPFGKSDNFFHNNTLTKVREERGKGFKLIFNWKRTQQTLSNRNSEITITLYGDWNGTRQTEEIDIKPGQKKVSKNEFASLSCIKCEHPIYLGDYDKIIVTVKDNLRIKVPKMSDPTIDLNDSDFEWEINKDSFVNLRVPDDYKVYWIGHTTPVLFFSQFTKYHCYFIPRPGTNDNVEGILSLKGIENFTALDNRKKKLIYEGVDVVAPDFGKLIKGNKFNGGLLMAQMKGGIVPIGAASYIYPPQPGAFPESAIYILPRDLYRMDDL